MFYIIWRFIGKSGKPSGGWHVDEYQLWNPASLQEAKDRRNELVMEWPNMEVKIVQEVNDEE